MASLTQDLLAQLAGPAMQQISQQLGTSPEQTTGAVGAALPLLLGKLGSNAAQPQGAEALLGALQNNHSGMDISSVLGSVLGGGGGAAANGAGILGHIFGGQQQSVQSGVAQASGLGAGQSGQLLQILAPIVMAYLGKKTAGGNANALSGLLGQEQQAIRQQGGAGGDLLSSLLDQDGDGKFGLGDALKIGSSLFGGR